MRRLAGAWFGEPRERPYYARIRCDAIGIVLDDRDRLVRLDHLEGAF